METGVAQPEGKIQPETIAFDTMAAEKAQMGWLRAPGRHRCVTAMLPHAAAPAACLPPQSYLHHYEPSGMGRHELCQRLIYHMPLRLGLVGPAVCVHAE